MLKNNLIDILVDPILKSSLLYDAATNTLISTNNVKYEVIDDVPNLLSKFDQVSEIKSPLHEKENSIFNYQAHYKADAEINDYFNADESTTTKKERERSRQTIISKVPKNATHILDVGCGEAWVAKHFTAKNVHVVSMDIAPKNPVQALQNIHNLYHNAVIADVFNLPFKENTFDVIIASEVIEHLYDPTLFVEKLLQVLKPNGKLILLTPYNEKLVYHTCVHCNHPTPSNAHLYSFNEENIHQYLPHDNVNIAITKFNNKIFIKLRLYNFLHFLPFKAWYFFDKIINKVLPKQSILIIEIIKLT